MGKIKVDVGAVVEAIVPEAGIVIPIVIGLKKITLMCIAHRREVLDELRTARHVEVGVGVIVVFGVKTPAIYAPPTPIRVSNNKAEIIPIL